MIPNHNVAVLIGSLRRDGFSRRIAAALMSRAPASLAMHVIPIGELPIFNQDDEPVPPPAYVDFRTSMHSADAFLFVTPEYNRGVPGGLKNAIDVGSRPYGESVFDGKPAAIVSQSPGLLGGMAANHSLRPTLMVLNVPTMAQPEMYLGQSGDLLDIDGAPANEDVAALLDRFLASFAQWVTLHARQHSDPESPSVHPQQDHAVAAG